MLRAVPALLAAALAACSLKNVVSDGFALCRQGSCRGMADGSREELLRSFYAFLQRAEGRELELSEASPGDTDFKGRGIHVFTQGGPMPGSYKGKAIRITDVVYMDQGEGVVKFKARFRGTYLWVPVLCAEGTGTLSVTAPGQAHMELSNLCTWLVAGTSVWKWEGLVDRLDLDAGLLGARYAMKGAGPLVVGGGKGYLLARISRDSDPAPKPEPAPAPAAVPVPAPVPVPLPSAPARPKVQEAVEEVSAAPSAVLTATLRDAGGDSFIDAGESFTLRAEAANTGLVPVAGLRLLVSGTPALASALPAEKALGALAPGAAAAAELTGRLAAGAVSQAATLRVEAVAEPGSVLLAAKTFKVALRGASGEAVETLSEPDVDEIPRRTSGLGGPDDAALVVGISRYRDKDIPGVKYAARDAELVAKYLERVGGVPAENIKVLTDDTATKSDLEAYLTDWLPRRVKAGSRVFVYFAGHGSPDLQGGDPFIVPYEGQPDFPSKLLRVSSILASLAKLPARGVVVMLDSCFSGTGGRSILPAGARPLVTSYEAPPPPDGRIAVFSAASGSQVSSDYDKAKHGLFTYALLRGLRGEADADADGTVTLGELFTYSKETVSRRASRELNRDQTPTLSPSPTLAGPTLSIWVAATGARR